MKGSSQNHQIYSNNNSLQVIAQESTSSGELLKDTSSSSREELASFSHRIWNLSRLSFEGSERTNFLYRQDIQRHFALGSPGIFSFRKIRTLVLVLLYSSTKLQTGLCYIFFQLFVSTPRFDFIEKIRCLTQKFRRIF